jgi:hypothetical protein
VIQIGAFIRQEGREIFCISNSLLYLCEILDVKSYCSQSHHLVLRDQNFHTQGPGKEMVIIQVSNERMLNTANVAKSCKKVSNSGSGNEIVYCSFHLYYVILYYFKTKSTYESK